MVFSLEVGNKYGLRWPLMERQDLPQYLSTYVTVEWTLNDATDAIL
jgi:hypothetical protein